MTSITLDGLSDEDFRRSIENRLREGRIGVAIDRLRALLVPYAGPGRILPARFLTVEPSDLILAGWTKLGGVLCEHDRPGRPVTAMAVAFGWPGEDLPQTDDKGRLRPCIEVSYYNDDSFPFSKSCRDDLLEGYSYEGSTWNGDAEAIDSALALEGIDDLYGALAQLEARLLASEDPDPLELCAGSLGACLLSVLLVKAVKDTLEVEGLPRPMCVMAGSNGVYPYFDAPVAGVSAAASKAAEAQDDLVQGDRGVPVPRYSSLLVTGIPRARKRAVLVLDENEDEAARRIASLRNGSLPGEAEAPNAPVRAPIVFPSPEFQADPAPVPEPEPEPEHQAELEREPIEAFEPLQVGAFDSPLLLKKPARTHGVLERGDGEGELPLQQRLQSLLAAKTVHANPLAEPEPEAASDPACEPAPSPQARGWDDEAWPGWAGDPWSEPAPAIEPDEPPVDESEPAPRRGVLQALWSGLKAWIKPF